MTPTPLEALLVYAVVMLCTLYCLWAFCPASLKRRAAAALMAKFARLRASRKLQSLAQKQGGCGAGCGDCGSSPARPVREHKVQLFRRR
jgi:hypothetical protein